MINRSKIKYTLKKILPKTLFVVVLGLWQKIFIKLVDTIDAVRLKSFTTYRPVDVSHHGHAFSLFISPQNGFIDKHIYLYGVYEPFILDLIAQHLKKGDVFVDIGANIGQHTMFAASVVGTEGKVSSFEPIPRVYNQLLDSARINHFEDIIDARNIALGEAPKTETLYVETNNVGGSSIVGPHGKENEEIVINIKRGDDELKDFQRVDMIKMDVEGYEYEVLAGIQKVLAIHKPVIVMEFSGKLYFEKGRDHGNKIISLLQNLGYNLYDVENYMKQVVSKEDFLSEFSNNKKAQCDLLCLPQK
ncbi:MAG: FkbM family methyltransferase [Candidatus Pacebacteria bacterium]|jgi:FkbM family methyltransferase|nr:FkbM family methyltransferase [Candidatus Paceibacterota bacterium]